MNSFSIKSHKQLEHFGHQYAKLQCHRSTFQPERLLNVLKELHMHQQRHVLMQHFFHPLQLETIALVACLYMV